MNAESKPILRVENLVKHYAARKLVGPHSAFVALNGVSLSISPRTTLALVGESGSGKSTLARCIACLERPTSGEIWFEDRSVGSLNETEQRALRPQIQLVFQDPARSFNPRWTALEIVGEPLLIQSRLSRPQQSEESQALLDLVGISRQIASRSVGDCSGGQRQRIAIARALALQPKLLVLDEALSALDCSIQAQIANLLLELQCSLGLSYLFITHDFAMTAHLADQIAVMDRGQIVESGAAEKVLRSPDHHITRGLLAATLRFSTAPTFSAAR